MASHTTRCLVAAATLLIAGLAGALLPGPAFAEAQARRLFISGHSLTDRPMPDMMAAIAAQAGRPLAWQRQHIGGSTIKRRSQGDDGTPPGSGYAAGLDRDGKPIDMPAAFAARPGYDVLLITEWHRVLDAIDREDTVRHLRAVHDRFMASNPSGTTYFYAPWADLSDRAAPQAWIDYERGASRVWQCVVRRANDGLVRENRKDAIRFVPASLALAELVADLTSEGGKPGFEGLKPGEIVALLFSDKVHLTEAGNYFVALVTYASLFGGEIAEAWAPDWLDPARAATLRAAAARFLSGRAVADTLPPGADCATITRDFIPAYTAYMRDAYALAETGYFRATIRRLREMLRLMWRLP